MVKNGSPEQFRAMLDAPEGIILPGCHDVLSAIMLEGAGFSCCFLSGYGVAASYLGNPDIGLTTLSETALLARNVVARVSVPVVVDADNGYGNEDNVIRTLNELEYAGAAAMIMEDQVFPKRCGHTDKKMVVPLHHYMRKLESVLRNRRSQIVVIARTDAMSIDEAIMRAKTFHSAGADVTLVDGLRSMEDMKRVAGEVPGHKQINLIFGGKTPILPSQEIHALGFKVVLYSTPTLYVTAKAMADSLKALHASNDLNTISDVSMPFKQFQSLIEARYVEKVGLPPTKYPSTFPPNTDGLTAVTAATPASPTGQ
jgi:2,3-dimethylmalate lyase